MKPGLISIAISLALAGGLGAAPITYEEVSLMVRMHEGDAYIAQQVSSRRLVRPLTQAQEAALQAQGASAAFLQILRNPGTILSDADAVAFDLSRAAQKKAVLEAIAADAERENARLALAAQAREREAAAVRETSLPKQAAASEAEPVDPYLAGPSLFYPRHVHRGSSATFVYNDGRVERFGNPPPDANCPAPPRTGAGFVQSGGGTLQRGGSTQGHYNNVVTQRPVNTPTLSSSAPGPVIGNTSPRR